MGFDYMIDAKTRFDKFLAEKNLRYTKPRDYVVDAFLRTEKHVSTQELYDIVRKKHPEVGYATVSRTLKLVAKSEIGREVDFGDGIARFEHEYGHDHHDHLVCTGCGSFVEIYSKRLEKIQDELVKAHGYTQQTHRLNIFGLCPKCQKKKNKGRKK